MTPIEIKPTELSTWRVVEQPTELQPQPIYHIHLSGAPAWLSAIGQLPTGHLMAIAAAVGSLGGVLVVAFMAMLATLATVGMVAIAGIAFVLIASMALGAMVKN